MIYLLNTNTCIRYLTRRRSPIVDKIASLSPQDIALCDIVKAELYYGAYKRTRLESNLVLFSEFFGLFVSLPFDSRVAKIHGRIRAQLETLGTPIGPCDLQIAALAKRLRRRFALANNLTLVTHNTREFGRVETLQIEDWQTA